MPINRPEFIPSSLTSGRYVARNLEPINPALEKQFLDRFGPRPLLISTVRKISILFGK